MKNLAILALIDFENWNNQQSLSMGGTSGVIKSILPYLKNDNIYLIGISSDKKNIYQETHYKDNITILPIVYVPKGTKIPFRIHGFYQSRNINSVINKYNIVSIYSHSVEMLFWIKPGPLILMHMHGATNALENAKNKLFRNRLFKYLWEQVRKENIKKATKIITIDTLCFKLIKKLNYHNKAIQLPNFVDTNVFYKDKSPCQLLGNIDGNILLFVGRIEEVKGLELFVDTLIALNKKADAEWRGVFVGRGGYESVIKNYISNKSANDFFYFTGPVYKQDIMRGIYNRASSLMISSHFEGIPMVILESLACGTPVVSTDVGGVKELIADNIRCFVIDQRDPSEFADLIINIISNQTSLNEYEFPFSAQKASEVINEILISS